jgi:hypothetical protein
MGPRAGLETLKRRTFSFPSQESSGQLHCAAVPLVSIQQEAGWVQGTV